VREGVISQWRLHRLRVEYWSWMACTMPATFAWNIMATCFWATVATSYYYIIKLNKLLHVRFLVRPAPQRVLPQEPGDPVLRVSPLEEVSLPACCPFPGGQ
jgi:hypothetical protein